MFDFLLSIYPWVKALHVFAVVSWMAGLLYLPRLFVYHAERGSPGSELSEVFKTMERRLLRGIMGPAMSATWLFGLMLVLTPGIISWRTDGWIYVKLATVIGLTGFHHWLIRCQRHFAADRNRISPRGWRLLNELPAVALLVILVMVIVRPI